MLIQSQSVPPFSFVTYYLDRLPNERHNPWACLWEVLLVALMLVVFWLLTLAKSYQRGNNPGRCQNRII